MCRWGWCGEVWCGVVQVDPRGVVAVVRVAWGVRGVVIKGEEVLKLAETVLRC